jgi:hypothetical protein
MSAEILNNTLSVGKDLIVDGKIQNPTVNGTLTLTSAEDNPLHARLQILSSNGTEIRFEGADPNIANIVADHHLLFLSGNVTPNEGDIHWGSRGVNSQMALKASNLCLGTTTLQAASVGNIAIANGTSPGALTADQIYIGAKNSAGTGTDTLSTLSMFTEEAVDATALDAVGTLTTRLPIWINDVCYWLYLDPV